jgi:hypothetical protein
MHAREKEAMPCERRMTIRLQRNQVNVELVMLRHLLKYYSRISLSLLDIIDIQMIRKYFVKFEFQLAAGSKKRVFHVTPYNLVAKY